MEVEKEVKATVICDFDENLWNLGGCALPANPGPLRYAVYEQQPASQIMHTI